MTKRKLLTVFFIISLLPMLMNQYGGMKGVQEISGLINLINPIGIISVIMFFIGIFFWFDKRTGKIMGYLGTVGIVISEIYKFFTWHVMTITGEISLKNSIRFAFPEFYVGLVISILMVIVYIRVLKKGDKPL